MGHKNPIGSKGSVKPFWHHTVWEPWSTQPSSGSATDQVCGGSHCPLLPMVSFLSCRTVIIKYRIEWYCIVMNYVNRKESVFHVHVILTSSEAS